MAHASVKLDILTFFSSHTVLILILLFTGGIGSSSGTGIGGEDGRGSSSIDVNKSMGVGAGLGGRSVLNVHGEASGTGGNSDPMDVDEGIEIQKNKVIKTCLLKVYFFWLIK